jgi:hypothetical protein
MKAHKQIILLMDVQPGVQPVGEVGCPAETPAKKVFQVQLTVEKRVRSVEVKKENGLVK